MSAPITVEVSPWRLVWKGGRLADVEHIEYPGRALDCVQVGAYDWQRGELERRPDRGALLLVLGEWVRDHGDEYARELRYLV